MITYLAIDVSKDELVMFSEALGHHYSIPNTAEAMTHFLQQHSFDSDQVEIGCESTGDYHLTMCKACFDLGFTVKVLNPIPTKQIINATVRKKKTDYSDAEVILQLLRQGHGYELIDASFSQEKRTTLRVEQKLVDMASDLKRIKKSLQKKYEIMELEVVIETVEDSIESLKEASKKLTTLSTEAQTRQEELIDSIPGCGKKLSAIISAEAGNIKRFPSARQLKAFVGIDPRVTQSGNSSRTGAITKRGNPMLRKALFLAANVARQHDPQLKAFYQKKRDEGKHFALANCAVARKLCERIYSIVLTK